MSESGPQHQKRFTWQLSLGNFTTCGTGHSKKIAKCVLIFVFLMDRLQRLFRQTAAEEMMNTLPDEWKKSPIKSNRRVGGGFNNRMGNQKRKGGTALQSQPPKKKEKEEDGKIVITADNPVSCLYEYAKKVRICTSKFATNIDFDYVLEKNT